MKRTVRNLIGVLLLSLAVAVTQIPVEEGHAANAASEFQMDKTTLVKYAGTAPTVSIPNTVMAISEEAFVGNETVTSIEMAKTVESIAGGAFSGCTALKRVVISSSVTSIGNGAFAGCSELTSVNIGANVKEIGSGVFAGCLRLMTVSISKDNPYFVCDNGVIYNKDKTEIIQVLPGRSDSFYSMPSSVTNIKEYAFWGCEDLDSVTLSNFLESVPGYAFSNCKSLKEVNIPYSVKAIEMKAFEDCINLETVALPESVGRIHDTAFDGCTKLILSGVENTVGGDFAEAFNNKDKDNAEYEDISQETFESHDSSVSDNQTEKPPVTDDTATILGSTVIVGNRAVVFIDNTLQTVQSGSATRTNAESPVSQVSEITTILDNVDNNEKGTKIPKYTIANDRVIANQAFYKSNDIATYNIPEGIEEIGEFSFSRSNLTSISIPDGVTEIGYGSFYHCDSLNYVTIPNSISYIEPMAFDQTGWVENWKSSNSNIFLIAGDGLLLAYNGNEGIVTIPEGVKTIGPNVFEGHTGITKVYLPDSLRIIGEEAFADCMNLSSVSGGTYVETIKDRAFAGCPIDTVRVPDTVKTIGLKAYDYSNTDKTTDERVIVFHGGDIPTITNEKTAERLSNSSFRDLALKGVDYAVVDETIGEEQLKGTVLDSSLYGFKGIIVSLNENEQSAKIKGTTLTADELNAFELPQTIEVYEKQYILEDIEKLDGMAAANQDDDYHATGSVLIQNTVDSFDTKQMSASLQGNEGAYYLAVTQSDSAKENLNKAYQLIYQRDLPENLQALDLTLYDEVTQVPIRKLGKQNMTITLPLTATLQNGTLHIICTDTNGQLEDVPYQKDFIEGTPVVTFTVTHFSDFGFYTIGSSTLYAEGEVQNGNAVISSFSRKDESPDTGDLIHPKWFLAVGLLFAALAFFLHKGKRNIQQQSA